VLDAVNVEAALGELDLLPLQVAHLGGPQAMSVGHQDHGRVAMPITAMLAGVVHQPLDFALGEIASFNCQVYDVWCAFLGCRFHADKPYLRVSYCICYTPFLNSQSQWRSYRLGRPKIDSGAKAACEGLGYLEGCQVARDRDCISLQ